MSDSGANEAAQPSPYARNIPVYYLFQFTRGFHLWVPLWFLFLQLEHGLSFTQIGWLEAIFGITAILAEVPTGAIADRFGRRVALAFGAFSFAAATVLFGALDYPLLVAGYLSMAVAMTLFSGSDEALLFDSLRQLGRSDAYERHAGRGQAVATASLLGATLLSGPLTSQLGFQTVVLLSAAGMGLAGLIALFLREPPRREAEISSDGSDSTAAREPSRTGIAVFDEIRAGARIAFRVRPVLWTILLGGFLLAALDLPDFFVQPFIRSHGVDPTDALERGLIYSTLLLPSFFGYMVGSIIAAPLAERWGEARALPLIILAGALCYVPLVAVNHLALVAAMACLAAATAATQPLASGYINRRIPSDQRATVLSIFAVVSAVILTVLTPIVFALVEQFDFRAAYALAFGLLVVGGGLIWLRWRSVHLRSQEEDAGALGLKR